MKGPHFIATVALAALLAVQASAGRAKALGKPDPAVRAWLPGCRAFLEHPESLGSEAAGLCAGAIDALLYVGEVLEPDYRFCVPLRTPRQQIISTIVMNVEAMRPEADRQDFKGMAMAILRFNWPCRE